MTGQIRIDDKSVNRLIPEGLMSQVGTSEKARSFTTRVVRVLVEQPEPYGRLSKPLLNQLHNDILPDPQACSLVLLAFATIRLEAVNVQNQRRKCMQRKKANRWPQDCANHEKQLISVVEVSKKIVENVLTKKHRYTENQIVILRGTDLTSREVFPFIKKITKGQVPSPALMAYLEELLVADETGYEVFGDYSGARRIRREIQKLIDAAFAQESYPLVAVDAWTEALHEILEIPDNHAALTPLLQHCETATSAKPSEKWLEKARQILSELEPSLHLQTLEKVLNAIGTSARVEIDAPMGGLGTPPREAAQKMISPRYADLLRGLVWSLQLTEAQDLTVCLAETTVRCFKKIRLYGPLSPKVGNACIHVLEQGDFECLGQLANLKSRIKNRSALNRLKDALSGMAEKLGLSEADLDDIAVPTLGLQKVARGEFRFGEFTALLCVRDNNTLEQSWIGPNGKEQKRVPSKVQTQHPEELKAFKKKAKSLKTLLTSQRTRIERSLGSKRALPLPAWRARYWEHPVVGHIGRRLIWWLKVGDTSTLVLAVDDALMDVRGQEHTPTGQATFSLWHPIQSDANTVACWRRFVEEHEITQPFRQAHREVYKLTEAERSAVDHTPRFSGIVVVQRVFKALCGTRGWHHDVWGHFDGAETPYLILDSENLHVELDLNWSVEFDHNVAKGELLRYLEFGCLRFFRRPHNQKGWLDTEEMSPLPLVEIPSKVFSEVMRDLDLFASVANAILDPDFVRDNAHSLKRNSEFISGEARRDILATIISSIGLSEKVSVRPDHLHVRGTLREYTINYNSSSILMSPNSQHLCIVADRKVAAAVDKVFLPFDGDTIMSLILSKAMLLANDDKIKDSVILEQIRTK